MRSSTALSRLLAGAIVAWPPSPGSDSHPLERADQPADAEARAGTEHADRRIGQRFAAADLRALVGIEMRHRERHGREIVEHVQSLDPEMAAQLLDRERPGMVGERHLVAGHRAGDRERRRLHAGARR